MYSTYIKIIHKNSLRFSGCKLLNTKEINPPKQVKTGLEGEGASVEKK
jgi:hypothetical protein